ncbi:DUF1364 domain-containing protein [Paraburkholderia acidisoli]|uniref:DUF1364 family protein n=1 Tax=Paraburkholderia acidisoli TaxID=2571748 RepID=A0A7Z2GR39_9BURK|nr:DUF1364 family protein [Paraburkholderia acidisoli]
MKRSSFGPRKTPLKRSAWPLATAKQQLKRSEMKRRVKKPTVAEGSKYLEACRGADCYLRVASECWRVPADETVVPCHDNSLASGKGMGIKSSHEKTVPGCFWCHRWLDQGSATRAEKRLVFDLAYAEWEPVRTRKLAST